MNVRTKILATTTGLIAVAATVSAVAPTSAAPAPTASRTGGRAQVEQVPLTDTAGRRTDELSAQTQRKRASPTTQTFSTEQLTGKSFSTLGLSWKKDSSMAPGTTAGARFHKNGKWGTWQDVPLELGESVNEAAQRAGAPSFYSGDADGVQLRVTTPGGALPKDLRLALVDPKNSSVDPKTPSPAAKSAPGQHPPRPGRPVVNSRADWGADESIADPGYKLQPSLKAALTHHTVTGNNSYTRAQVPQIINGIYVNLIENQGYGDFPYHFVVDRFGGIWEGRKGSAEMRPGSDIPGILGGHAQGFNTNTFGVAALGNFEPDNSEGGENTGPHPKPSKALRNSLADLLAWKLGQYGLDPKGDVDLTSAGGGGTNPHPPGTVVPVDVITSHRDVNVTACPGQKLYDYLPKLRKDVAKRMR
ncbi:N-acetylmuramoyl-L-alanine amidase [Streptomyces sp. NPDC059009]|uniref:N-acetylmuramoyl-L-alanine amidase n=1 Tax=Streptomyces sp. NPDC059009 TaxID=3346694 RepID=UPI0036D058E1